MYDATGGARIGKLHRRLSKAETLEHMPDLDVDRLSSGFLYYDARVDDARLTLAVVKTAVAEGAVAVNYAEAAGLRREGGRITGVEILDRRLGRTVTVRAGAVVVAAGVWNDAVAGLDTGSGAEAAAPSIRPAKGVHITLPGGRPRLDVAAVLPSPGDRRSVFVIPWADRVYVGTTDTDYDGPLLDPACTAADVDYLLAAVNSWIGRPVAPSEVLGTWAGLRPLVKSAAPGKTADMSRRHSVRTTPAGLISVVGGKLTTYRKMAEDAVDAAYAVLGVPPAPSRTASLPISGAVGFDEVSGDDAGDRLGLPAGVAAHLAGRYGGQARAVAEMIRETPDLAEPLVPGLPYLRAEATYAARYEMALTLEDVLSRRTRALLLDSAAAAAAAADVAALLAPELGWSEGDVTAQVDAFRAHVAYHRHAADPTAVAADARALTGPAADEPGDEKS
jgi:glycerol-3-phosphate dehydrogenase